jgi:colanic acid biosynthesis protein WcaH
MRNIPNKEYKRILMKIPIVCVDGLLVNPKGETLLVKRKNHPLKNIFYLPGGRVIKGEEPIDAFKRKMKEETGFNIKKPLFVGMSSLYSPFSAQNVSSHTISLVFTAMVKGEPKLDGQSSGYKWSKKLPKQFKLNR